MHLGLVEAWGILGTGALFMSADLDPGSGETYFAFGVSYNLHLWAISPVDLICWTQFSGFGKHVADT